MHLGVEVGAKGRESPNLKSLRERRVGERVPG